jgi:lipopolysaccharide cholinephosphotransferase
LDRVLRRYKVEDTNWIVNFMGQYKFKEMFPKSYYGKGKLYTFEDMQLMGPEDADKVLTQMYGDYMKEPDDCDKNVHDAYLVEQQA